MTQSEGWLFVCARTHSWRRMSLINMHPKFLVGNNMGLPFPNAAARNMALTFGSMGWFIPNNGNPAHVSGRTTNALRPHDKWPEPVANITWPNRTVCHLHRGVVSRGLARLYGGAVVLIGPVS
jgi:hypothetical protein